MKKLGLIALLLGASACAPNITVVRLGGPYLALAKNCQVRFDNVSYADARTKWNLIGVIALPSASGDFDEKTKEVIRERSCALGGEVASLTASFNQLNQFMILRSPDPALAPAMPDPSGVPAPAPR